MYCNFQPKNSRYECPDCGATSDKPARRNCEASGALGERVAAFTKSIGIKPCGGCQKRREALNRATVMAKKFFKKK